jgi:phosphoribosyl-ATP pyrophosphohydrolase/phosphoribosyl-AMP cyclohydrolase
LKFDANGLIPAIVQHAHSGEVLMLGYMNDEALRQTQETGYVTFWSRSRQQLWTKGSTSGNWLHLVAIRRDCDEDVLLVLAEPTGPTCHTGQPSCFYRDLGQETIAERAPRAIILQELAAVIHSRRQQAAQDTDQSRLSYTAKLLRGGVDRIGKKVGEEATEVVIAAKNNSAAELTSEAADLLYHLLVLLEAQGVSLDDIWRELWRRSASAPTTTD